MYCPYCQTVLPDDAVFCRHCGKNVTGSAQEANVAPVQLQVHQYQAQQEALRNSELSTLDNLLGHFGQKQAVYDQYDDTCQKLNHFSRGARKALLIWGCILAGFGLMFGLALLAALADPWAYDEEATTVFAVYCTLTLIPAIPMIIGGILMITGNKRKFRMYQEQYAGLAYELNAHYLNYRNCPIAPEYTNPRVLFKLQGLILADRAETLKEGLNQLIASSHQHSIHQHLAQLQQSSADMNSKYGLNYLFIPARFFR